MDYSIKAEVERREEYLAEAQAVAEAYPDAQVCWLDAKRFVFVSPSVKPTRVDFLPSENSHRDFAAYVPIPFRHSALRVYLGNPWGEVARAVFSDETLPDDVRAALIALVKP